MHMPILYHVLIYYLKFSELYRGKTHKNIGALGNIA